MTVSGQPAPDVLLTVVERIEHLRSQIDALNDDVSEVYKNGKGQGLDPKIVKMVIARRRKDPDEVLAEEDSVRIYLDAIATAIEARNKREVIKTPIPATPKPLVQAHARAKSSAGFETAAGTIDPAGSVGEEGARESHPAEVTAPRPEAPSEPDKDTTSAPASAYVDRAEGVGSHDATYIERRAQRSGGREAATSAPGQPTPTPSRGSAAREAEDITSPSAEPGAGSPKAGPNSGSNTIDAGQLPPGGAEREGVNATGPAGDRIEPRRPRRPRVATTDTPRAMKGSDRESEGGATDGPSAAGASGANGGGAGDGRAPSNDHGPLGDQSHLDIPPGLRREAAE